MKKSNTKKTPKKPPQKLKLFATGRYALVYYGFKFVYKDQWLEGSIYTGENEPLDLEHVGINFDGADDYYYPEDDFPEPPAATKAIESEEVESFREWLKIKVIAAYRKELKQ